MICDICHQNEATIHIQEIVDNQKKTVNICQECATKKASAENLLEGLNLAKFLYNITSQKAPASKKDSKGGGAVSQLPSCPACGWTAASFGETGRLGCAECYKTFRQVIFPALKNMHRGTMHVGKKPSSHSAEADKDGAVLLRIMELQKQLEECILREEFEKAARLRDRISGLKGEKTKAGKD